MEDLELIIFVSLVVGVAISYILSKEFFAVAERKGYHDKKYFWICFFLGMIGGYLLIIALPNQRMTSKDYRLIDENELPDL